MVKLLLQEFNHIFSLKFGIVDKTLEVSNKKVADILKININHFSTMTFYI